MDPYSFSALCFVFCSFFVGILVWLKRLDQVGMLFFWHSICISLWGVGFTMVISPAISYEVALWAARSANGVVAFIPIAWFHFSLALTNRLERRKRVLWVLYGVAFIILCLSSTSRFIPNLRPILNFKHYTNAGPFYILLTVVYFLTVPLGFYELIRKIHITMGEEKKQLLGLLVVSFLGYLGGSLSFIPVYGIPFPQYGLFLLPIFPFGLAFVMTRTNLFEVEQLARAAHRDKLTAIGVLAASINHEVRNPLFIIKGLAESCLERQEEGVFPSKEKALESANDAMKRSMEQADRAMDIIKRLSLFAKAGIEGEMKLEAVSVPEVLESILPLVRYELAAHGIALTRDMPSDLPEVRADRRYLEEILFNLIVNACQAIKETGKPGEIKVTCSQQVIARSEATRQSQNKIASLSGFAMTDVQPHRVIITIQDNGPGIPADKLKDVFRPFYTTKAEGTGLGLYITQQLIEKIHGRINVRSEIGVGTSFSVILEAKKASLERNSR